MAFEASSTLPNVMEENNGVIGECGNDSDAIDNSSSDNSDDDRRDNHHHYRPTEDVCGNGARVYTNDLIYTLEWHDDKPYVKPIPLGNDEYCRHKKYDTTQERLKSFNESAWATVCPVSALDLAEAGFFRDLSATYTDGTICFYCGVTLYDWKKGDVPLWEHIRHYERCSFAFRTLLREQIQHQQPPTPQQRQRHSSQSSRSLPPLSSLSNVRFVGVTVRTTTDDDSNSDVSYRHERRRVMTFFHLDAPLRSMPSSKFMAAAGFYYVGHGDDVRCFACNRIFGNWTRQTNPREVHARLSPYCPFVRGIDCDNVPMLPFCRDRAIVDSSSSPPSYREATTTKYPRYADLLTRQRTFPPSWNLSRAMAHAGFFQPNDTQIMCYACGGSLRYSNITMENEKLTPKELHTLKFPFCSINNDSPIDLTV